MIIQLQMGEIDFLLISHIQKNRILKKPKTTKLKMLHFIDVEDFFTAPFLINSQVFKSHFIALFSIFCLADAWVKLLVYKHAQVPIVFFLFLYFIILKLHQHDITIDG